jgi:RNA polymerase primary sigma factor
MTVSPSAPPSKKREASGLRSSDSMTWYLATIGREPLLTPSEEIELGNQVQKMMELIETKVNEFSPQELKAIRVGRRAKDRMIKANLRLVVSIAKKYQGKGLELLDLIQEGSLGLERAVEKFDPSRGYKFSTYAFWWIRQSMTRAIACQSRTIRLPVHLSERLTTIRKVSLDLAHKLGAMPSRQEIAAAIEMPIEELDSVLRQSLTTSSLDAPIKADEGNSCLVDLIADSYTESPLELVQRSIDQEQLALWLSHLNQQEREVLSLRFGLDGHNRHSLAEIGRNLNVSRERIRQVELKALRKLRQIIRKSPVAISI